jgi:hypothetical protein
MSGSGARARGCGAGADAQPAINARSAQAAAAIDDNGCTLRTIRVDALVWVFLEILAALAIAVAIVWWTLPRKPKGAGESGEQSGEDRKP